MATHDDMKATRDGYGDAILELGKKNKEIVVLTADLSESTKVARFRDEFPDRFFEMGIAEQNMTGVAVGLSFTGKIPFVSTFSIFGMGRAWEQVRLSVCYSNANVKIVGTHSGFSDCHDGASHQILEDISNSRTLPNMKVIVPCDYNEAKKAIHAAAKTKGPMYIRLARDPWPVLTEENDRFEIGKANIMKEGSHVTIIACGRMVHLALEAAKELEKENISARVINLHTIKPIDEKLIIESAEKTGAIVTAEEHQIKGGMGSAVLEVLSKKPVPVSMVGVNDRFGSSGQINELLEEYGLTKEEIKKKVHEAISLKQGHF